MHISIGMFLPMLTKTVTETACMSRWHLPMSRRMGRCVRLEVWNLEVDNSRGGRTGDVVLYNTHPWYRCM